MRLLARLKSSTGLVAAILCVITLVFYHDLWWPGLVLIHRDALRFYLPIKQHLIERLSRGIAAMVPLRCTGPSLHRHRRIRGTIEIGRAHV